MQWQLYIYCFVISFPSEHLELLVQHSLWSAHSYVKSSFCVPASCLCTWYGLDHIDSSLKGHKLVTIWGLHILLQRLALVRLRWLWEVSSLGIFRSNVPRQVHSPDSEQDMSVMSSFIFWSCHWGSLADVLVLLDGIVQTCADVIFLTRSLADTWSEIPQLLQFCRCEPCDLWWSHAENFRLSCSFWGYQKALVCNSVWTYHASTTLLVNLRTSLEPMEVLLWTDGPPLKEK